MFDTVAVEYDRRRPTYPDELVERACELGGLRPATGCSRSDAAPASSPEASWPAGCTSPRSNPAANLIELAGRELRGPGALEFVNHRLEDAPIDGWFAAAFSASAFHWPDPDVSWAKVARALRPDGLFALHSALRAATRATSSPTTTR